MSDHPPLGHGGIPFLSLLVSVPLGARSETAYGVEHTGSQSRVSLWPVP